MLCPVMFHFKVIIIFQKGVLPICFQDIVFLLFHASFYAALLEHSGLEIHHRQSTCGLGHATCNNFCSNESFLKAVQFCGVDKTLAELR